MPSIIGHSLVGFVGASSLLGFLQKISKTKLIILSFLAVNLPDIDVLFVHLGFDQEGYFGHRNFFHSIFFALMAAPIIGFLCASKESREIKINFSIYFFLLIMSHNFLDALTQNDGVGVLYPVIKEHLSLPFTPLLQAGFNFDSFSGSAFRELLVLWIPSLILIAIFTIKKQRY